jgi:hypothetical protein
MSALLSASMLFAVYEYVRGAVMSGLSENALMLAEELCRRLNGYVVPNDESGYSKRVALFFFVKAHTTYEAITLLLREGSCQDGLILLRTLFELAAQVAYMQFNQPTSAQHANRAKRFVEYEAVSKCIALEKVLKVSPELFNDLTNQVLDRLRKCKKRFQRSYGRDIRSWYGKSFEAVCADLGKEWHAMYKTAYASLSSLVHSDLPAAPRYVDQVQNRIVILDGSDPEDRLLVELEATRCLAIAIEGCNSAFSLELDEEIQKLEETWRRAR